MYTKGGGRSLGWNLLLIKNDIDNKNEAQNWCKLHFKLDY